MAAVIVSVDDVGEVIFEFVVIVVVISLHGRLFDRAVLAFNLAISPVTRDRCKSMLNAVFWQARYPVPLQTPMCARARHSINGGGEC